MRLLLGSVGFGSPNQREQRLAECPLLVSGSLRVFTMQSIATIGIRVQPAVREKLAATEKSMPSTPGGPATGDSILPVPSRQVLR